MKVTGQDIAAGTPPRARRSCGARAGAVALLVTLGCLAGYPALADGDEIFEQNRTTYGDIGLIEVPTARMADDGQLSLSVGALDQSQRIGLGFQMLPWLETSFRYSHIQSFFPNGDQLFDRSFGVKVRLFQETAYTPAVAIGARDIVGTGIYGAEFVVLSKRFWTVDFTAGLGWGRLASTEMFPNPLGSLISSFNTRATDTSATGGTVNFGQLFHGPDTSLFGGLNWQTPIDRLNLLVEYSSDRYLQERRNTGFRTRMPVNVAASYRIFDNVSFTGGWLYGSTWGGVLSIHFDPREALFSQRLGPQIPLPVIRTADQRAESLQELERNEHQVISLKDGGAGINLGTNSTNIRELLSAASSAAARDYEIEGHTLTINVEGPADMQAECRTLAQVAATSIPGIDTVAATDLSDRAGKVTLCSVAHYTQLADLDLTRNGQKPNLADITGLLGSASNTAKDLSIDGDTLHVEVDGHANLGAQCQALAKAASMTMPDIDTVQVRDAKAARAITATCSVAPYMQTADLSGKTEPASDDTMPAAGGAKAVSPAAREAEQKIRKDASAQNLSVRAVSAGTDTLIIYFENEAYYFEAEALGRLVRVLLADTPPNVEIFRIISLYRGTPMRETRILRSEMERILNFSGSVVESESAITLLPAPLDNPILDAQTDEYPRVGWSLYPRLARSFFDPRAPVRWGLFADASGYVDLWRGFTLEGVAEGNIYNDLASNKPSDSQLPHVRSDYSLYYEHGANGISSLDAVYRARLDSDLFAEVKAGYLEDMFMGVGGQVLWRPEGDRFAIGADVYQVWQRGFDRLFGAQSYNVVTGHASIYYQSPWYGMNFAVHAGRYLAGDWGGTIEISRRFRSGIEVGAFATFTNVPFAKFGEGSFDKGVIVRIPLEWLLPIASQKEANLDFRPLSRDGGQRLYDDDSLYDETRRTDYGEIYEHFDDIVAP